MLTKFSKPSDDIFFEHQELKNQNDAKLQEQKRVSTLLLAEDSREACVFCGAKNKKKNAIFVHRNIDYFCCVNCGHVQTQNKTPKEYPFKYLKHGFEKIYDTGDAHVFNSRTQRIYQPKLEWIKCCFQEELELGIDELSELKWLEVGCGAGFFIKALLDAGISKVVGLDTNLTLVAAANKNCDKVSAKLSKNLHHDIVSESPNVVVAFFVLEHLESAERAALWSALDNLAKGTIFIFSVPCVGFSTIFENSFDGFAARNLDNVIHTQLFTDRSISFMLDKLGYSLCGEWLFGQDGQDLLGNLATRSNKLLQCGAIELNDFNSMIDNLQSVIDRSRMCDARHIFCIKN